MARKHTTINGQQIFLPSFLMLRGGLLNTYLVAAALAVATASPLNLEPLQHNKYARISTASLVALIFVVTMVKASHTKHAMARDIDDVANQIDMFKRNANDFSLFAPQFPKMAQILIKDMSARDPELFNKLLANPELIQNPHVMFDIVAGHLDSHPEDAGRVQSIFNLASLPRRIYRKIERANITSR